MGFFDTYFIQPIQVEQGYNFVNTIAYALLAFGLLYLLFKVFQKIKFKIDYKLFIAAIPFVLFGSTLRAFVDSDIVQRSFWTVSPGIYLLVTGAFLSTVIIGHVLKQKKVLPSWNLIPWTIGFILLASLIVVGRDTATENITLFLAISLVVILSSFASFVIFKNLRWKWIKDKFAFSAFSAHLLDATVTAMILTFVGGWEKHPLPRFFIENLGPFSFIPLKLVVIIPAIYVISTELKDKQLRNFLLIAIAILGLAEGLRNLISLVLV